jgi:alpha-L-rhamnosidase
LQVNASTPRPLLATAYLAHSLDLVAQAAQVVAPARAAGYAELAARAKEAFTSTFVAPDGRMDGDTQTDYLLALAFNLVPPAQRPLLADHLVRTVEAARGLLTTGFVGVALLCPVLSEIGREDLAFALLETDRYPSWLYSVRHGATTVWERWDGWTEHAGFQSVEMNSFNHYSLGSVGEWLFRYVAGLDQCEGSVAFKNLRYQPRVGGSLTHVEAAFTSPRGEIASEWTRQGDQVEFVLDLPPGVGARATLPMGTSLEVDGMAQPPGPFTLESGHHVMRLAGLAPGGSGQAPSSRDAAE